MNLHMTFFFFAEQDREDVGVAQYELFAFNFQIANYKRPVEDTTIFSGRYLCENYMPRH